MNAEGLRPIRGPVVPGFWETNWHWAAPALLIALALVIVLFLWIRKRLRRPRVPSPEKTYRSATAPARAMLDRGDLSDLPTVLSRALRFYIEAATGIRAPEQTTEEFLAQAARKPAALAAGDGPDTAPTTETAPPLPPDAVRELAPFLTLTDEAKFGGRALDAKECRTLLDQADRFVAANEERRTRA